MYESTSARANDLNEPDENDHLIEYHDCTTPRFVTFTSIPYRITSIYISRLNERWMMSIACRFAFSAVPITPSTKNTICLPPFNLSGRYFNIRTNQAIDRLKFTPYPIYPLYLSLRRVFPFTTIINGMVRSIHETAKRDTYLRVLSMFLRFFVCRMTWTEIRRREKNGGTMWILFGWIYIQPESNPVDDGINWSRK